MHSANQRFLQEKKSVARNEALKWGLVQYLVTTKLNLVSCQNVLQNYKNADYALCTCSRIQRGQIIYEGAIYLGKKSY